MTINSKKLFDYLRAKKGAVVASLSQLNFKYSKILYSLKHKLQNRQTDFIGFDKYSLYGAYHWREIDSNPFYRNKADFVLSCCDTAQTIADFGCGDGAILGYLAKSRDQSSFIGVEADKKACILAENALKNEGISNVQIIHSAFSSLDSLGERVDLAFSMDVIEHLPDPEIMLKQMRSILAPGGRVIIGTPLYINDRLISKYHIREFSSNELRELVQRYFEAVQLTYLPERRLDGKVYQGNFCLVSAIKPSE